MDKSRQQFEAMAVKRGLSTDKKKDCWGQEKYKYDMIQIMWEGWQASRESLINNLEPIVYASEKDISDLKIFTYLFSERQSSESVNIPLYRLDK